MRGAVPVRFPRRTAASTPRRAGGLPSASRALPRMIVGKRNLAKIPIMSRHLGEERVVGYFGSINSLARRPHDHLLAPKRRCCFSKKTVAYGKSSHPTSVKMLMLRSR